LKEKSTLTSLILQYRTPVLLGLAALTVVDAAQLAIPLIINKAVDALVAPGTQPSTVARYGLYLVGLGLVMSVFRFVWRWFLLGSSRRVEQKLRNRFFAHLQSLGHDFFARHKTGDLMAHTVNDIEAIRMACGVGLVIAYDGIILTLFILGAMIYISPTLALMAFAPFPLLALVMLRFGSAIERTFEKVQGAFSDLTESASRTLSSIKVIKASVAEEREAERFARVSSRYMDENNRLIRYTGVYQPLIAFFSSSALAVFLFVGGRGAIVGEISLGEFAAIIVYLGMLTWPMVALGWATDVIKRGNASLKRVNQILSLHPPKEDRDDAVHTVVKGDLHLEGLRYTWGENGGGVKEITLHVRDGSSVAITGTTGSGKSTLLKLLIRLLEPERGLITLDGGLDLRRIKLAALRRDMIFVPQDTTVFSGTVAENIAFMNPSVTREEIEQAARVACIYDDIMRFPDGFDTYVGERGLTLSGGQRQRLALARAVLMNPKILVLDDVLSSLDLETERAVIENLRRLMSEGTLIAVSSRVPSIIDFDTIAVVEGGRVVELGNHEELMKRGGIYSTLYRVQTASTDGGRGRDET